MPRDERPGSVPEADEQGRLIAAPSVVTEYFARVDRRDLDSAVDLYADDATFMGATGKGAIRTVMERGLAPNAHRRTRHVVANVRASHVDQATVRIEYTALAYTLDPPAPPVLRTVLDQEMYLRPDQEGRLRIADHRILDFQLGDQPLPDA